MKISASLILSLLLPVLSLAQGISGRATYKSATSLDFQMDSSKVAVEQQDQIRQMLVKSLQKEYELTFTKSESQWKEVEKLDQGFSMMGIGAMLTGTSGLAYKNVKTQDFLEQQEFLGKIFLIEDTLKDYHWELEKETKKIGNYTCYKAVAYEDNIAKNFMTEDDSLYEKMDTARVKITAWYTPQIPVSHGPDSYWGLPGLILQIQKMKTTLLCTKVVLNTGEEVEVPIPEKGEKVTRQEFRDTMRKKMLEMREMYGGPGGKGKNSISIPMR